MSLLTIILLAPAAILLVAGIFLFVLFSLSHIMQDDVHFESTDRKWADTESTFKAHDYQTIIRNSFEAYKNTTSKPVSMVRTTPVDWRRIRLWPSYLMNPKWRVPYAPRKIAADQMLAPTPEPRLVDFYPDNPTPSSKGKRSRLFDAGATASAVEYLDQCLKHNSPGTLVDMLGYVDHRQRVIPALEEINEALEQRVLMRFNRANRAVIFSPEGHGRRITEEDLARAYKEYRKTFRALLRRRKH